MTPKEALIEVRHFCRGNAEALKMAEKALEKQIPKKPYHENIYKCSCCHKMIGANYGCIDYCISCGQHIDWSEE